jgi:predicted acetyltransferase
MMFSDIPSQLFSGPICLEFEKIVSVDPGGELVPFYHFKIVNNDEVIVGHINFRVGDTRHVKMCAGHIGYEILPKYRGSSYSYYACKALVPLIKRHYDHVVITVDPFNLASIRIIERLGATYINEIEVPKDDPAYAGGARIKRRYEWKP